MKKLILLLFANFISHNAFADTQDYINANIILVKSQVVYFDVGEREGVAPGESFEIYSENARLVTGRIAWADTDISKSEPLDLSIIDELSAYQSLTAKIRLLVQSITPGGHLSVPIFAEPRLEPASISTPIDMMVARMIHRGLITRDASGRIVPDLCDDYEIRDLTYTFYLDPDTRFHNGKPVEASDVLYSLEQLARSTRLTAQSCFILEIKGAKEFRNGLKNEIAGVFLIDNKTLSITVERPFPAFEEYLAGPAGYIIPRPGMAESGSGVTGAGAYRVKWLNSDAIVVEPFEKSDGGAFLDSLSFIRFGRVDEAGLSFELGRLDMINLLGEPPPKFVSKDNFTVTSGSTDAFVIVGINNSRDFQADGYFGKALSFLIDRGTLIRVILGGSAEQPVYEIDLENDMRVPLSLSYLPDSAKYYFDAVAKLPRSLVMYVDSRYPVLSQVSRYLMGQLQKRGVKIIERKIDLGWIEESSARNDMDLYLTCYIPAARGPDCVFYPLLSEALAGETNFTYYSDYAVNTFLDSLHTENYPDRQDSLVERLLQSTALRPPVVFLYKPHLVTIMRGGIAGFIHNSMGYIDLRGAHYESGK
jgi:peptide/nickel transport system substrate-binding protein